MIRPFDPVPLDAGEAALCWATRKQADPARFASDPRFAVWLEAHPANAEAWERAETRDALLGSFAGEPEIRGLRREALQTLAEGPRPRKRLTSAAIAASVLLAALGLGSLTDLGTFDPSINHGAAVTRVASARAERKQFVLGDGSRVALNGETLLDASYTDRSRTVRLIEGQALFEVAKEVGRPFVVMAGNKKITATGTAFEVLVGPGGQVRVVLLEGKVQVDPMAHDGLSRLIPFISRRVLEPGQQFLADQNGAIRIEVADVEKITAWNRGLIILRNDTVAEAVAQFNRTARQPLVIVDPAVGAIRVSGVFPDGREEDFAAALEAVHHVAVRKDPRGAILLSRSAR